MNRSVQILIFEYLLADESAWNASSRSMRTEAFAMLNAMVQDFCGVGIACRRTDAAERCLDIQVTEQQDESSGPNDGLCTGVRVSILVSPAAVSDLAIDAFTGHPQIELVIMDRSPEDWLAGNHRRAEEFAATFVIAPECNGILCRVLRILQSPPWNRCRSLNLPWRTAQIFSDKLATCEWLALAGLPTVPTSPLTEAESHAWKQAAVTPALIRRDQLQVTSRDPQKGTPCIDQRTDNRLHVIKPRDGAGCDSVTVVCCSDSRPMRADPAGRRSMDEFPWVIQPFQEGVPCSIGLIGGGSDLPPLILPSAVQSIQSAEGQLRYSGGCIPAPEEFCQVLRETAVSFADAVGPFHGYIGIDIVVSNDGQNGLIATVVEVNPRLCTSYVGYRCLSRFNLALRMLASACQLPGDPGSLRVGETWGPGSVRFVVRTH